MYLNWVLRGKISSVVFQVDIFGSSNLDWSFSITFMWSSVFSPLIVYRSSRTIGRFLRQPNGISLAIFPTTFFLVSYDLKLSFLRPQNCNLLISQFWLKIFGGKTPNEWVKVLLMGLRWDDELWSTHDWELCIRNLRVIRNSYNSILFKIIIICSVLQSTYLKCLYS